MIYYYNLGTFANDTFVENSPKYFINYPISHNRIPNTITRSRSKTPNAFNFTCGNIFYKQPKSKKTLNSISYAAAALWNKLPLALKQSKTTQNFKKNLKNWLTKDYISSREIINADITL